LLLDKDNLAEAKDFIELKYMELKTEEELLSYFAEKIANRGLTTPAIFLLEAFKPLNLIGSQVLIFLDPLIKLLLNLKYYQEIIKLLENRENIERLIIAIENCENQKIMKEQIHAKG
jgi:hypothetical protein